MLKYLLFLFILMIHPLSLAEEDVIFYTEAGYAEFTSSVPLHSFSGKSENLTGMIDLEENIVDFYLDLNTLKTGIGRRDRDMYRTLNVEEHPFAEFTGSVATPFDENSFEEQLVTVEGEFTLHGVTRQVRIDGFLQNRDDGLYLNSEWIIELSDYEIEPPGILFYRVDEEQGVKIEALLQPVQREQFNF